MRALVLVHLSSPLLAVERRQQRAAVARAGEGAVRRHDAGAGCADSSFVTERERNARPERLMPMLRSGSSGRLFRFVGGIQK